MKIIDAPLLAQFRTPGECEFCKRLCKAREPHHLFSRGAGQLDLRINLIALGVAFTCQCHREVHDGNIGRAEMLAMVAQREGVLQGTIEDVIFFLRRLPRGPRPWQIAEGLLEMTLAARCLASRILAEHGCG